MIITQHVWEAVSCWAGTLVDTNIIWGFLYIFYKHNLPHETFTHRGPRFFFLRGGGFGYPITHISWSSTSWVTRWFTVRSDTDDQARPVRQATRVVAMRPQTKKNDVNYISILHSSPTTQQRYAASSFSAAAARPTDCQLTAIHKNPQRISLTTTSSPPFSSSEQPPFSCLNHSLNLISPKCRRGAK